jgi:hypothetical protein
MTTTVLFASALLLVGGCDCDEGSSYCDGNQLNLCGKGEMDSHPRWHRSTCPVACRQLMGEATCVDSPTPIPECDASKGGCLADSPNACWKGSPTMCFDGYPTNTLSPCGTGLQCIVATDCRGGSCDSADCVPNPADMRCHDQSQLQFCDGNSAVSCWCGYVVGTNDCSASGGCNAGSCAH